MYIYMIALNNNVNWMFRIYSCESVFRKASCKTLPLIQLHPETIPAQMALQPFQLQQ